MGSDKKGGHSYEYAGKTVLHEDICAPSFPSESVDLAVCLDVLEHIPNYDLALEECYRVLKPGGQLLITVPFYDALKTQRRADIISGELVHFSPAEFHGNPISGDGALVFTEPGIDLIESMKRAGFSVQISLGNNLEHGLLPDGNSYREYHCWNLVFVLTRE